MSKHKQAAYLVLFLASLSMLAMFVERVPAWTHVKAGLRRQQISGDESGSLTLIKILRRIDRIHPDFRSSIKLEEAIDAGAASSQSSKFQYRVEPLSAASMPSSRTVPDSWRERGLPLLSLTIDKAEYNELLAHPFGRGKQWERLGYVSYIDKGELLFGSGVKVRMQGGMSRKTLDAKSFHIYFGDKTGANQFPPGLLFSPTSDPIRRFVAHNNIRFDNLGNNWHFIRPLAYDIFSRLGVVTPEVSPVWFLLNGEPQGVYILAEHLGVDFLQAHYGHANFVMIRQELVVFPDSMRGGRAKYQELRGWIAKRGKKLSMVEANEVFDIENLSRWFAGVLYCGTTDALQQPLLLNREDPQPRWFWMAWDLDHSFKIDWGWKPGDRPADIDIFRSVLKLSGREKRARPQKLRSLLLSRLIATQEYRRYLAELIQEMLNHILTPGFLNSRLAYYADLAAEFGIENEAFLSTMGPYFVERPKVLRHQMQRYLKIGASYRVDVKIDSTCPVEVDGYRKTDDYTGWYIGNSVATLQVHQSCSKRFSHWEIREASITTKKRRRLKYKVNGSAKLTAVLKSRPDSPVLQRTANLAAAVSTHIDQRAVPQAR